MDDAYEANISRPVYVEAIADHSTRPNDPDDLVHPKTREDAVALALLDMLLIRGYVDLSSMDVFAAQHGKAGNVRAIAKDLVDNMPKGWRIERVP